MPKSGDTNESDKNPHAHRGWVAADLSGFDEDLGRLIAYVDHSACIVGYYLDPSILKADILSRRFSGQSVS
jgi:hypothetical protein